MTKPPESTGKAPGGKKRIGDTFVDQGLLSDEQLRTALRKQSQDGGHLGSVLIEMGFITIDNLLDFLSKQSGFPAINLYKTNISRGSFRFDSKGKATRLSGYTGCH